MSTAVPSFGHVFVIVGENEALSEITASAAPYLVKTLKPNGAWFTGYDAVTKGSLASLADYVALTSGQYAACEIHGPCGAQNVPSILSQLGNGAWKDWNESMPSNCYRGHAGSESKHNAYKPGHNPALFFTGLPCSTYDVPAGTTGPDNMSHFNAALASDSVPKYNFITPNLCEAGYNWCPNSNGIRVHGVPEYNDFLQKEIPAIESSRAFAKNGMIFITFDEGSIINGRLNENTMMLVLGPQVVPGTYSGHYDHYSTLRTIEDGLGLPCLANACSASNFPIFSSP